MAITESQEFKSLAIPFCGYVSPFKFSNEINKDMLQLLNGLSN